MANTPTTLERASFAGQLNQTFVAKLNSMASYALGTTLTIAPINGVITNVMNSNTVQIKVLGNARPSGTLLLPKGSPVT